MTDKITPKDFHAADGVEDWRVVGEGACAVFRTDSFAAATAFVQAIAELGDHHPDVDVRRDAVTVRLITITPDYFGLSARDLEAARRISLLAREHGLTADPSAPQSVLVGIDVMDRPAVQAFWRALLGYDDRGDSPEDLIDPRGRGPMFWFQQMDEPRPQRNRIHFDVWVPHDRAEERIAAAVAAGGRVVTEQYAPNWWVLADPEGNEACICTWMKRD